MYYIIEIFQLSKIFTGYLFVSILSFYETSQTDIKSKSKFLFLKNQVLIVAAKQAAGRQTQQECIGDWRRFKWCIHNNVINASWILKKEITSHDIEVLRFHPHGQLNSEKERKKVWGGYFILSTVYKLSNNNVSHLLYCTEIILLRKVFRVWEQDKDKRVKKGRES